MEDKLKGLRLFEFGIPAHIPSFEETITQKPYVLFGEGNLQPQHSIDMFNFSSINRACLNAVIAGIVGKDLLVNGSEGFVMANSTETIYDIFKKTAVDYAIHGGISLNTIKRKDGEGISDFYHIDFSKVRSGKVDDFDYVKEYFYSADWTRLTKYKAIEIPAFNLRSEGNSQIFYSFPYQPNQKYYPLPSWIGGRIPVQIDIEIMNHELNNLQNGYFPSLAISLNNGIPSDEERNSIYRHLEDKYSSTNNSGKMFLNFSDSKENEPTFTTITPNTNADLFNSLNEIIQTKILTAHGITKPDLLGIKTAGQLGSKQEIIEGYEHFLRSVIAPKQQYLIREFEKLLFYKTGEVHKITIVQNELFEGETEIVPGVEEKVGL
tara:strand:- start:998 stop:2131 length:1134 start_codon:yes stop_codon:yes gene_type:complete